MLDTEEIDVIDLGLCGVQRIRGHSMQGIVEMKRSLGPLADLGDARATNAVHVSGICAHV